MSSTIMVGNSTGWNRIGSKVAHANTGHASDVVGIMLQDELVQLAVGDHWDAHTRADKRAFNQALNYGWVAHTLADCRIHRDTAAVLEIERNFDEDGMWVVARYTRTS